MAHDDNLNYRVPANLKEKWQIFCEKKRIKQTEAAIAVLEFVLVQDDLAQSMILGQIEPADDLIELVLTRLQRRGKR